MHLFLWEGSTDDSIWTVCAIRCFQSVNSEFHQKFYALAGLKVSRGTRVLYEQGHKDAQCARVNKNTLPFT